MRVTLWAIMMGVLVGVGGVAAADAPVATDDIRQEMQSLQARMVSLESRLAEREHLMPPTGGEGLPQLIPGVNMSGFLDTSYSYSLNEPNTLVNTLRGFDTRSNGFMLNNLQLNLSKPVSEESRVGFASSLMFGTDAEVIGGVTTGLGGQANELEILEAYAEILAPLGNGLDIKVGKFATLHGAEAVASKDNWNFTRSFLWLLAEPVTHTGVRFTYAWSDWLSTCLGVSNGWDVVDDNNKGKTVEFNVALKPFDRVSIGTTYMFGAEQGRDNRDQRHFFSTVLGWDVTDRLSLKGSYDLGWEEDVIADPNKNSGWDGFALYARYALTDWWALAGRYEWFRDRGGVRTAVGLDDVQLMEWTLTNEFKVYKDMIARVEYRHDKADSRVFTRDQTTSSYQDTVSVEMIYPF